MQLEVARATPVLSRLITTPSPVWRRWTHCRIIAFLLLIHYFTPWPWPLTLRPWNLTFDLENLQRIACDVMKLCTKFERNRAIRGGVIAILVFDLVTLNIFKCCARLWNNFHQVWPSTTYPCLNYSVFWCWYVMSCCDLDLWLVDLESSWKRHVCTKFERNRATSGWIIDNFVNLCTRYVTLWPWLLISWPWTFTALWVSCV